jgi:hypothetical protein
MTAVFHRAVLTRKAKLVTYCTEGQLYRSRDTLQP